MKSTRCTALAEDVTCAGWPRWSLMHPDVVGYRLVGCYTEDDEDEEPWYAWRDWSFETADPDDLDDDRPRLEPWEWNPDVFCDASKWCGVPEEVSK